MSLLQIPREIRQKIFDLAICSPTTPPASPSVSQEGRTRLSQDAFDGSGIWHLRPQNPSLSLLLVNKQFNDEAQHALKHISTNYHVDIMFVKDYGLWPTWHIPILPDTQYINSINASFRLFNPTDDLEPRFQNSMSFISGDGGPELAVWSFYSLLTEFLARGPGYLGSKNDYIVKEININVLAPTDGGSHKSIVSRDQEPKNETKQRRRPVRSLFCDTSVTPEKRLAMYMANNLGSILHIGYHTTRYGMPLWENVADRIVFLVNGTEYKRFEMEDLIENHKINWWGETPSFITERKEKYQIWRHWLDERRQRIKEGIEINDESPVTYIM
ncbi:hypothetical protein EDB81DRAFT_948297 [Dactylonectria macrodidyma]|uniref:Uncharacterized protein n=1 Tax=Dactylonectria macrodidyma TaxID=307937 RepID=A0A9P9ERX7_9HYPO|nr:hypothetical protein EDB81DRAFT_948297 [Dactylonectria macrodidyma]